jgi:putative ABC transport system substrate-binding protein
MPRIGIIDDEPLFDNFRQGLRDLGYVENQNIAIEYRSAESKVDRLAQAARELVSLPVDVIVVTGTPAARAARQATSTIPIVFISIGDPVKLGFVVSLARPGGNMTGNSEFGPDLIGRPALMKGAAVSSMPHGRVRKGRQIPPLTWGASYESRPVVVDTRPRVGTLS